LKSGQNCPDREDCVLDDRENYAPKELKFVGPYRCIGLIVYKYETNIKENYWCPINSYKRQKVAIVVYGNLLF
ncbi:MAG: hypothetical protein J6R62_02450, partial [Rikenellaceae bacterium]|nr:hypothetical protein [Rikenellaceae bacterium]